MNILDTPRLSVVGRKAASEEGPPDSEVGGGGFGKDLTLLVVRSEIEESSRLEVPDDFGTRRFESRLRTGG